MNGLNRGSLASFGSLSDSYVVGTLPNRLASVSTALVSVVRNLTRSQASEGCSAVLEIPTTVPPTWPEPYSSGRSSATGNGAVPKSTLDLSSEMKVPRHSPSYSIAIFPCSKPWAEDHSEFGPPSCWKNVWRSLYP